MENVAPPINVEAFWMTGLTWADYFALAWFCVCWFGFAWFAERSRWSREGVQAAMAEVRSAWMQQMLHRENRVVDSTLIGNLLNGTAFFASTSILATGGLFALLGATEQALRIAGDLPFAVASSRAVWELKILLLLTITVHAFFKFAWAYRLFNYCSILVGAAPVDLTDGAAAQAVARRAAGINTLAARHFNRGLRAYFFTLAALAWIVHPYAFVIASGWVVLVLYRREFRSQSLGLLREPAVEPAEK